jgi:hypothetical protein
MSEGYQIIDGVASLDGYTMSPNIYARVPEPTVLPFYKSDGQNPSMVSFLWVVLTHSVNAKSNVELSTLYLPNQVSFPPLIAHSVTKRKSASGRTLGSLELIFENGSMSFSFEQAFSLLQTRSMKAAMSEQEFSDDLARQIRELRDD